MLYFVVEQPKGATVDDALGKIITHTTDALAARGMAKSMPWASARHKRTHRAYVASEAELAGRLPQSTFTKILTARYGIKLAAQAS